jgi:hypothetical protein
LNLRSSAQAISSFINVAFVIMSVQSSNLDIEILPAEEFSYVLVDPGVFRCIQGFSYGRVLVLDFEEGGSDDVKVTLVRTGNFDTFEEELFADLHRDHVLSNRVTQAEALNGSRSLVGSHVGKVLRFILATGCGRMEPSQIVNGMNTNPWLYSIWLQLMKIS